MYPCGTPDGIRRTSKGDRAQAGCDADAHAAAVSRRDDLSAFSAATTATMASMPALFHERMAQAHRAGVHMAGGTAAAAATQQRLLHATAAGQPCSPGAAPAGSSFLGLFGSEAFLEQVRPAFPPPQPCLHQNANRPKGLPDRAPRGTVLGRSFGLTHQEHGATSLVLCRHPHLDATRGTPYPPPAAGPGRRRQGASAVGGTAGAAGKARRASSPHRQQQGGRVVPTRWQCRCEEGGCNELNFEGSHAVLDSVERMKGKQGMDEQGQLSRRPPRPLAVSRPALLPSCTGDDGSSDVGGNAADGILGTSAGHSAMAAAGAAAAEEEAAAGAGAREADGAASNDALSGPPLAAAVLMALCRDDETARLAVVRQPGCLEGAVALLQVPHTRERAFVCALNCSAAVVCKRAAHHGRCVRGGQRGHAANGGRFVAGVGGSKPSPSSLLLCCCCCKVLQRVRVCTAASLTCSL